MPRISVKHHRSCSVPGAIFRSRKPQRGKLVPFDNRRQTVTTRVGTVAVGSAAPIVVQSMTNTDTADAAGTADQVVALAQAGSQLVRVTVNNEDAARAVPEIARR